MKPYNVMEAIVAQKLDQIIDTLGCCQCELCKWDIICYVLNRIPPKYVITHEGELFSKLDTVNQQYEMDVVSLLTQAAKTIKTNPRH
ncbi:late competence development ComFB family protein [Hydrogenoanaerobacterium sp.]|uniref:late competence development ComFB family protein n=1 Tax=Hydrogenoanaerobacterium sp. TaxID=2953763 RepID=UPI0028967405|nr:late competence development ComFB family protein [Hydrogenoanaerobacterium sp.]